MKDHRIAVEYVPLHMISQHPENANNGDMDAIEESITFNGFYSGLVVQRSSGYILAGNHRYMAAIKLGYSEVPVIWLDVDDEEATRIMVADNRTARLGQSDESQMLELLESLYATDVGLAGTGYDVDNLQYLLNLANEPLAFAEPEPIVVPELLVDPDSDSERAKTRYLVTPLSDDEGGCTEILIMKPDMGQFRPSDLNRLLKKLGQQPLDSNELASYEIPKWQEKQL